MIPMSRLDPVDVLGTPEHAAHLSEGRHPGVASALAWLAFSHLPEELRGYARPFYEAAVTLVVTITTDCPELTTALNKLIEAKDWGVRAGVRRATGRPGPMARPQTIVDPPVSVAGTLPHHPKFGRPIKDDPQA